MAGGGWHAQYLFCLFVLLWVALILFDSLSQQSQESLEPVSGGCVWGLFLCDWLYLTGASIPQLASAGASCLCYTKMLYWEEEGEGCKACPQKIDWKAWREKVLAGVCVLPFCCWSCPWRLVIERSQVENWCRKGDETLEREEKHMDSMWLV